MLGDEIVSSENLLLEVIQRSFPIFASNEYEALLNNDRYSVGVDNNYPAELRERLTTATISYTLQNKSLDYTRKTYLKDMEYEEDPGGDERQDRRIRNACLSTIEAVIGGLVEYRRGISKEGTVGECLSDITLVRIPYSVQRAFAEGDKGALFEALVIVRMALEQLCWAISIRKLTDSNEVKKPQSQNRLPNYRSCIQK